MDYKHLSEIRHLCWYLIEHVKSMRMTYLRYQWQQHPPNSSQDQLQAPAIRLLRPFS